MRIKKVYKYGTGDVIPSVATYLCTKTETEKQIFSAGGGNKIITKKNLLVWHYFLVEVDE